MSNQTFPYRPLSEPDSFRILHLQPSQDKIAQICCKLEHKVLRNYEIDILSPYTALSYVWGDVSNPRIIQVDGQPFQVTRNLHDALECLRDNERVCIIWADAICINQFDIPERNAQVEQMGRIYSCATHTVILLDSLSHDLECVLREVKRLKGLKGDAKFEKPETVRASWERIVGRPWFGRVWILQELVLSKDPFVQCGRARVTWDAFCGFEAALQRDKSLSGNEVAIASGSSALISLFNVRSRHICGNLGHIFSPVVQTSEVEIEARNTLSDLVISRRGYGATDPRDIIYAQMGVAYEYLTSENILAQDGSSMSQMPKVDYSKSVAHVPLELPSWVPDWSQAWHPSYIRKYSHPHGRPDRPTLIHGGPFQQNKHFLITKAIVGAEIVQMGATVGLPSDLPETSKQISDYFPELSATEINTMEGWTYHLDAESPIAQGFQKLMHAWSSAIGLPDATLLPVNEVSAIARCFHEGKHKDLWASNIFANRPFLLMSIYHDFTSLPECAPSEHHEYFPPLLQIDRFCTVRGTYSTAGAEYQIIVVPESAQVGDVIATMSYSTPQNWVVLRSVKVSSLRGEEEFPPTYEFVGVCHPMVWIRFDFESGESFHVEKIALV